MIVFVSYSNKNRKAVEDLVLQLGQLGHDVQFESKVIGGDVTWQQVLETIASSDLFVATLTAETLVSYTAHIENEYARDLNKYILFVALDELSTLNPLDPKVRTAAIDFSEANPNADHDLAAALSAMAELEPRTATAVPAPNLETSLSDLRHRVKTTTSDAAEQTAILMNIHEFLERHETFDPANNLLAIFTARGDLRPEIKIQAQRLTTQVKRVGSLIRKIQQRGIFYAAIILSLLVSLAVVLLSQAVLQFRAQRSSTLRLTNTALTLQSITSTFTQVPTRFVATAVPTEIATELPAVIVSPSAEVTADEVLPTNIAEASLEPSASEPAATLAGTETSVSTEAVTEESTSTVELTTNTPKAVTGTAVSQALNLVSDTTVTPDATSTPKPSSTRTPVPATRTPVSTAAPTQTASATAIVPPKPTSTVVPTEVTEVSVLPTSFPTQMLPSVPTDSMANLEPLISQKLYVGIRVIDSVFGIRVSITGAAAKAAGVQVGDYILAVDNQPVRTRFEFLKIMQTLNHASEISLRLRRDGKTVDVPLVLSEQDFALPYPN